MSDNPYGAMPGFNPVDPTANFAQGMSIGQVIKNNAAQKAAAEAEAQRKENYSIAFDKAMDSKDPSDYMELVNLTPEDQRENFMKAWGSMEAQAQQNAIEELVATGSAFASGKIEVARKRIQTEYDAAFNDGDKKAMALYKMQLDAIDEGQPEIAEMMSNNTLAMIPGSEGYLNSINTMRDISGKEQEQALDIVDLSNTLQWASPEDKANALSIAETLPNDAGALAIKMSNTLSNTSDSGITSNDMMTYEKNYNLMSKKFSSEIDAGDKVLSMANLGTGAGDTTMITLYQKVLDGDSVVRPSEFETTMRAQGMWENFKNTWDKIAEGKVLSEKGTQDLVYATRVLQTLAREKLLDVQTDQITLMESKYVGIPPEDIITDMAGTPADKATRTMRRELINLIDPTLSNKDWNANIDLIFNGDIEALTKAFPEGVKYINSKQEIALNATNTHSNPDVTQANEADIRRYLKSLGKEQFDLPWDQLLAQYGNTLNDYSVNRNNEVSD